MAVFDDVTHYLTTLRLKGNPLYALADETWQIGLRCAAPHSDPLPTDSGRQELPITSVQDAFVSRSIALFNVSQGFSGVTVSGTTVTDADQDALATLTHAFLVAIKATLSTLYVLDSIRVYPVGPDGRSRTAPSIYTPTGVTGNPTGTGPLPTDVALAMSTGTATRGVKGRGRMFLGSQITTSVDTSADVKASVRTTIANAGKAWLDALRAHGGAPGEICWTPIIWHRQGDKMGLEDGTFGSPIRLVRVDDRFDTQRRRDRQVIRNWTTALLA